MGRKAQPLPYEELHAYAAGEVEPKKREAIEAHLETCETSRARLAEIHQMLGLFTELAPRQPDDLAWQRMQNAVQTRLDAEPSERWVKPSNALWFLPAAIAAAVLAIVLLVPKPEQEDPAAVGPQRLVSGAAALEAKLTSHIELKLAPHSEVLVTRPALPTELALEAGELDVSTLHPVPEGPVAIVTTPAFIARAESRDFTVAYSADAYFVETREGVVHVEGEGFDGPIHAGQRRTVQTETPARPSRVTTVLNGTLEEAKKRPIREVREGETRVQVLDDADPLQRKWREAARAYYEGRDLERATQLAAEVIAEGAERVEARMAEDLLCEASIAMQKSAAALTACTRRLERPITDEERRGIHFQLARIHHRLRSDCAEALPHYAKAMVFGGTSVSDDRARLFRADCALQVGDWALAKSDVDAVKSRRDRLHDDAELGRLIERLKGRRE